MNANPARAIATSTLWQIGSHVVTSALAIIMVKLVAVGLSKEMAGHYNTAYGYLQLFAILADFGLYSVAVREVSRAENRSRVLSVIFLLRLLTISLSLGGALSIAWLVPHWQGTPLPLSISIALFVPAFTLLAGVMRSAFQVTYRMHYVFIAEVAQRIVSVGLIGLLVFTGIRASADPTVLWLFLSTGSVGALVLLLLSFLFGHRLIPLRPHWDGALIRRVFAQAAPFGIAYLCIAVYRQFDITLIANLRPHDFDVQNAYYGFVLRILDVTYLLPTLLLNSALPELSRRDAQGRDTRKLLGYVLLTLLLLTTTIALFAALWPRPLIRLLTTEAYLATADHPGADTALRLLALPMVLNSLVTFSFYVLLTRGRWKPLVMTLGCGAIFSLVLNFLLIPQWGFVGATWTSNFVHVFLTIALLPQALRTMPVSLPRKELLQWILYSAFQAVLLWLLLPFVTSPLRTILGGAFIGLWLVVFLWFSGFRKALPF
ncbi:MAG: oligosaccharide flippase family protein [Candidatus Peribacteraceae bacterium]|nr:oligosaccharide flippase family protein [Candidatus Peribacteraceae bacterium]